MLLSGLSEVAMSLKVMCAGCSAEERERAESDVRRALGARATGSETWIVSVINLQSRWSVTLDGPGIRALNCAATPGRLAEAIQEALQSRAPAGAGPAAAPTPPAATAPAAKPPAAAAAKPTAAPAAKPSAAPAAKPPAAPAAKPTAAPAPKPAAAPPRPASPPAAGGGTHECAQCHQRFRVTFDAIAGEPEHMTPVACPHCWHTNHVMVGETAADTNDYRAEKA
jgi:hypothetical protein